MTWLMTWRVASSQGIRLPLCQILEVVWIGIGVEVLLRPLRARILIRVSRFEAACHGRGCVGKGAGFTRMTLPRAGALCGSGRNRAAAVIESVNTRAFPGQGWFQDKGVSGGRSWAVHLAAANWHWLDAPLLDQILGNRLK